MKIIGLTGGVGSGKTQILEYLNNKYGATICQTDALGKKLQKRAVSAMKTLSGILEKRSWMKREN